MAKFLRPNHSTAAPGSMVFCDVQCYDVPMADRPGWTKKAFAFGTARYLRMQDGQRTREKEIQFVTPVQFWNWLVNSSDRSRPTWVFCHELTQALTALEVWDMLERTDWLFWERDHKGIEAQLIEKNLRGFRGIIVDADPPSILHIKHVSGIQAIFLDVRNYFDAPVADIAHSCGLSLPQAPSVYSTCAEQLQWSERKLDVIDSAVTGLVDRFAEGDLGRFRYTSAALAHAAYRHRLGPTPQPLERPDAVKDLERRSYYGGRLELLYVGDVNETVWELDVQSMYPSVMRGNNFPWELAYSWLTDGPFDDLFSAPGDFTIAEVLVDSTDRTYPIRLQEGTLWVHGRFWTVLCGPELRAAFSAGSVCSVARWATYRLRPIFDSYVDYFWTLRRTYQREGNRIGEQFAKSMLNSLYGKFGQQSPRWVDVERHDRDPLWGKWKVLDADSNKHELYRSIAGRTQLAADPQEHPHSFVGVSAFVTAYARERIRELVAIAGPRNCYYVVTDALYVNQAGLINLQQSGEIADGVLGKLRIVSYGDNAKFSALHRYTVGRKSRHGGRAAESVDDGAGGWVETVLQRMGEVTASRPDDGVLSYKRPRKPMLGIKRSTLRDDGWTEPITILADCHWHLLRMRDRINPPSLEDL